MVIAHPDNRNEIMAVHLYTANKQEDIKNILETDEIINGSNAAGKLYVHHQKFGLVPSHLFNPSHTSLYLNFYTDLGAGEWEIAYDGVSNNTIQVLGAIDKSMVLKLDGHIPELEVSHGATQVLDYILQNKGDLLHQEIFISLSPGSFYIAGFKEGELVLFNRFAALGEEDFVKYVLTVLHQLAFDRMHCKITVYGSIEFIHCELNQLQSYFKNIHQIDPVQNITYHSGAENFKNTKLLEAFWSQSNL